MERIIFLSVCLDYFAMIVNNTTTFCTHQNDSAYLPPVSGTLTKRIFTLPELFGILLMNIVMLGLYGCGIFDLWQTTAL